MPKFDEEESIPASSGGRHRSLRTAGGGKGFFSSFVEKAKRAPAHYWVIGLGAGALAVDYFVEGENSLVLAAYRGIFGRSHEGHSRGTEHPRGVSHHGAPGPSLAAPGQESSASAPQVFDPMMGSIYFPAMPPVYPAPRHHYHHHLYGPEFRGGRLFPRGGWHGHHHVGAYSWE